MSDLLQQRSDWEIPIYQRSVSTLTPQETDDDERRKRRKRGPAWMCCLKCCLIGSLLAGIILGIITALWLTSTSKVVSTTTVAPIAASFTRSTSSSTSTTSTTSTTTTTSSTSTTSTTSVTTTTTVKSCICSALCWNQTGIPICGTDVNPVSDSRCVYISPYDGIYLCGHVVNQVLACGINNASTVGITTNYGDHMDYIAFDKNGSIYVNSHSANLVRRHSSNIPSGTIIAGTGSGISGALNNPIGVAVDDKFNVYIGDRQNKRVVLLAPNAGSLATAIDVGSTNISMSALLLSSTSTNQIYISDEDGKSVYLWTFNATSPSVIYTNVAGGSQLNNPRGLKLDSFGNLYVADQKNNRIVVFCANSTIGHVVLNTSDNVMDLAFDSKMNMYVFHANGKLMKYAMK